MRRLSWVICVSPKCCHICPGVKEAGGDLTWPQRKRQCEDEQRLKDASLEDWSDHKPKNASSRSWQRKETYSLLQPHDTLISAQWYWFWTSGLQSWERINSYRFKPPCVGYYRAIGNWHTTLFLPFILEDFTIYTEPRSHADNQERNKRPCIGSRPTQQPTSLDITKSWHKEFKVPVGLENYDVFNNHKNSFSAVLGMAVPIHLQ